MKALLFTLHNQSNAFNHASIVTLPSCSSTCVYGPVNELYIFTYNIFYLFTEDQKHFAYKIVGRLAAIIDEPRLKWTEHTHCGYNQQIIVLQMFRLEKNMFTILIT